MSVRTFIFSPQFFDVPSTSRNGGLRPVVEPSARRVDPGDPADQALVTRVRESAEEDARAAFDVVYAGAYDRLVRFAARLVGVDAAHDVVQDIFVALWTARATWHAPTGSLAYLYSAVRNRALKDLRHANVVGATQWRVTSAWSAGVQAGMQAGGADRAAETAEFDVALAAVLAEFPERRRTAFLLRAVDGLGYDAIGAVVGISGPGAYKQVAAAVRILRERLAKFAG